MKTEIIIDIPINWDEGADPLVTDTIIKLVNSDDDLRQLNNCIIIALGQMKYGDVKKIIIKKLN